MCDTLTALYDCFYAPPDQAELEREVDECHQQLIQRLDKPERKLVLRIIDAQGAMAETVSMDSFAFGLKLGLELAGELRQYRDIRPRCCRETA